MMANKTEEFTISGWLGNLKRAYVLSWIVAVVTAVTSIVGLTYQATLYPTEELRQAYVINDVLNLLIGLPILLGPMWLVRRGQMVGLLLWPGGLLYGVYNYTAYIFGMPLSWNVTIYLIIVLLSAYTILKILNNMNKQAIQAQIANAVPTKTTGWLLVVFGALFIARAAALMVDADVNQTTIPIIELGTSIADILLSLFWLAGGVLLLRRMPLGYVSGLGLLFALCALFIGLILLLLIQPVFNGTPLVFTDVVVVAVMGLIFFVPLGLFIRGVVQKEALHAN